MYYKKVGYLEHFISQYEANNGRNPSEKMKKQYCKFHKIEYPLPSVDEYVKTRMDGWIREMHKE